MASDNIVGRTRSGTRPMLAGGLIAGAAPLTASASTPVMPAIEFPVDTASIVTAVGTAGAGILVLTAGLWLAFKLARGLIKTTGRAATPR